MTAQETPNTKIEYKDFFNSRPGSIGGRYLRRFWHPVYRSQDLERKRAAPIKVMHEDLTLYRGESGSCHIVGHRCAHRGSQLSAGWVQGEEIRCFYHGWTFAQNGQCTDQPAEQKPFCEKVKIPAYPHVREYIGLIWVYMGEGEPPELPRFPSLEDTEHVVEVERWFRPCNFFLNVENSVDTTHVCFTHLTSRIVQGLELDMPKIKHEETEWGVATYTTWKDGITRRTNFGMPYYSYVAGQIRDPGVNLCEMLVIKVPVDDTNHVQFEYHKINEDWSKEDRRRWLERRQRERDNLKPTHEDLMKQILAGETTIDQINSSRLDLILLEDDIAQVGQGATWDSWDRIDEHLGGADSGVVMIRRLYRREFENLAAGRPLKEWTYHPSMVPTGFRYS